MDADTKCIHGEHLHRVTMLTFVYPIEVGQMSFTAQRTSQKV